MDSVGSLPVPNVQALAADCNNSGEIPDRYIRPEIENEPVVLCLVDGDSEEIPVIDIGKLQDPHFSVEESLKLHLACQDWGFFQMVNHNIPDEIIERMKVDIGDFFKLPLEEKIAFKQLPGCLEGYGQNFVVSNDQKLDWADMIFLMTRPISQRNMSLWPTQPLTLRDTLNRYSEEIYLLADVILSWMAKNLGINPYILTNMHKDGEQSVRINYYPPCPLSNKTIGISPHSDATLISILLQVNDVQGLQIKKNNRWIPVKPLPKAFIVNIGDHLQIFSNDTYKSVEHRAVVNSEKVRLSIATFHTPSNDSVIGPHPEIVRGGVEKYKTMKTEDLKKLFFSSQLNGKSLLDHVKL